jgi:N-acylneuraminate cytidylyltransferase
LRIWKKQKKLQNISNNILYLIPARGGSKGISNKNIKRLKGRPLIYYTLDVAVNIAPKIDICVSTESSEIKEIVEQYGIKLPFLRPANLATNISRTYDVILHALNHYKNKGKYYNCVVLLQPTSPLRTIENVKKSIDLFSFDLDMVASVKETKANPYYTLYEEDKNGFLYRSHKSNFLRRQDCPKVWELNGAVYVMNVKSLQKNPPNQFKRIKKYVMNEYNSIDIDSEIDYKFVEFLLTQVNS